MGEISTNEMKGGTKLMIDNDPCSIIENEFVKPGKGQAFNRIKFRNLRTGRVLERTLKSGDSFPEADIIDIEVQYLYNDGEFWNFMQPETFEQYSANAEVIGDAKKWLKEQDTCFVTLWNNNLISVAPPMFVNLKVIETEPGIRGDTATGGTKTAKLETGVVVKVPLFVEIGDLLKIDTRTGEYLSRAKE